MIIQLIDKMIQYLKLEQHYVHIIYNHIKYKQKKNYLYKILINI